VHSDYDSTEVRRKHVLLLQIVEPRMATYNRFFFLANVTTFAQMAVYLVLLYIFVFGFRCCDLQMGLRPKPIETQDLSKVSDVLIVAVMPPQ
jgi:hypothetical protein